MKAFAVIFTREIFERRFAFVVAFAAGFVPLIGSLAYGWRSPDAAEGRVLVALVGATALSAAFAILLGAAVIAGDTKEKRISFYFSRPVASASLWAGKLLAAIAITLATAFLAFAPGWLSGSTHARSLWGFDATPGRTALAALVLAVVLVLGAHAVVTVARLRSPWVALDLLLAPTLVFLAALAMRSLLRDALTALFADYGRRNVAEWALIGLAGLVLLALLAASFVQVSEGRTDARRSHGAFSVVFFGIVGAAVALLGGYAWWCASAKATDLAQVTGGVQIAPRGSWVVAGGPLRAWRGAGAFLFDTTSGRSIRVRSGNAVLSRDGTRAAWNEPRFGFFERTDNRGDVFIADLPNRRAIGTGLEAGAWSWMALSPSGLRLAVFDGKTLAAFDVSDAENPKQIAVFRVEHEFRYAFVDEDTIRAFPRIFNPRTERLDPARLEIADFSLSSKKSLVTGRFELETLPVLSLSPDARFFVGTRRLTEDPQGRRALTLHDGRTGSLVATLAADLRGSQARFLTGGRVAIAGIGEAGARVVFFEGEEGWAAPGRAVELGPATRVALGGEIAPGRVAVSLLQFEENLPASRRIATLAVVDAASGKVVSHYDGLVPADRFSWWFTPVLPPAEAGSPSSSLFVDADSRLVRLDPATGAQTVLLGRSK
ncbi:MAG: hypothetical protein ABI768_04620 [Acidobacteriota bacterium]